MGTTTVTAVAATLSLDGSGNMVFTGTASNDTPILQADTANSRFIVRGTGVTTSIPGSTQVNVSTVYVPFSAVTGSQIIVDGLGGNDKLTVDYSLGSFGSAAAGDKTIVYDGGAGANSLAVTGTFQTETETVTTAGPGFSGSLLLNDGTNPAQSVTYVNQTSVDLTGSTPANLVFNLYSGAPGHAGR